jgi:DNA-binding SARP family transcriptional activator
MQLTIKVLGPLGVRRDGSTLTLTQPILRRLLAVLMCCADSPVAASRLAALLWTNDPPRSAHKTLQVHIHRLRGVLGSDRIEHSAAGYRIRLEPADVDALRFTELVARARAARHAGDLPQAHLLLDEALDLWDGDPYGGVTGDGIVADEARRLADLRLEATEEICAVGLDLGRHAELIGDIEELARTQPFRERFRAFLMLALYRLGRRSEALGAFRSARTLFAQELGVEPGPALQQLHQDILRADERLNTQVWSRPDTETRQAAAPRGRPRQLPGGVACFTGRASCLRRLDELLDRGDATSGAGTIGVITGLPGVGKTVLALRWAHRVANRFPDGQLYVNLRGFHPSDRMMSPADALDGFLEALGVAQEALPQSLEAKAGLYRSLLADRHVLILADNARSSDQLRPLLPGTPGCLLLATSRNPLTGLIATDAAQPITVDALTREESRDLVANRLGSRRTAKTAVVDTLVEACGRHPLALAVLSARATTHADVDLETLAGLVRVGLATLDAFDCGDAVVDVQTSFSWSSRLLTPHAVALLRAVGRLQREVFSAADLARQAGSAPSVSGPLAELVEVGLVTAVAPNLFRTSPLVLTYAAKLPPPRTRVFVPQQRRDLQESH